ncbi:hypothetical protein FITA111629_13770 [Filibacter tadaridae]|uniref:Polysaccharide deacetylase n=1 Tax=Filibacter tadaridae TaxID=2483811 RepID=A0A3P5XZS6_9BACL|nr:hypothetical protein [Filibacter tadaridae]VDC33694.1 hypothetical protein FILTAD_03004 [Filibacter tadaridae]
MEFTNKYYIHLLRVLNEKGYEFCSYHNNDENEKSVILRHDVDFTIEKALDMAIIENKMGVKSTYFVLLSTDFYNIFSKKSFELLEKIMLLGHEIGLHFDEKRYDINTVDDIKKYIESEASILSKLLHKQIQVISMHRPSKLVLENDIKFDKLVNSYSSNFFKNMKYVSDSRMNWRENPIELIESGNYQKLHILTHPFWYSSENETMEYKLLNFLNKANIDKYDFMNDNFRDLTSVISKDEIIR